MVGDRAQILGEYVVVPAVDQGVAVAVAPETQQDSRAWGLQGQRPGLAGGAAQTVREDRDGDALTENGVLDASDPSLAALLQNSHSGGFRCSPRPRSGTAASA